MRITGGKFKSKSLLAPPNAKVTRPTTDRVKETMFQLLKNRNAVENSIVLDLFAGSGALGLESLSRGAAHAFFVDSDFGANRTIAHNIATLELLSYTHLTKNTAEKFLSSTSTKFHIVFIDPPYSVSDLDVCALIKKLLDKNLLFENAVLCILREKRNNFPEFFEKGVKIEKNVNCEMSEKLFGTTSLYLIDFN